MKKNNQNTVLLTGASGFLGKIVLKKFIENDAIVTSLGRTKVQLSHQHTDWNIRNGLPPHLPNNNHYTKAVHIAGKAHVFPKTEAEKQDLFEINYNGTKNLLIALDKLDKKPKIFINISTVAVYGKTKGKLISELEEPHPNTPYGISKYQAEKLVEEWANKNNCHYLNLRLPLVAGENPPGNLGDMKKAIANSSYPKIKGNNARKSVVLATDVANFIEKIEAKSGTYNLTDGYHPTFEEIENAIQKRLNTRIKFSILKSIVKMMASVGDILQNITKKDMPISSLRLEKITSDLTFDDTKAREEIGWTSNNSIEFIEKHI